MTGRITPTWSTDSGSSGSDAEVARVCAVHGSRLDGHGPAASGNPPGSVPRYTRPVTRTYVAVVVVEVVVLAALWFLSRHFAA